MKTGRIRLGALTIMLCMVAAHAHASPVSPQTTAAGASGGAESDAERRDRLNARMAEMLRAGEGARLTQPAPPARRQRLRPTTRHATPVVAPTTPVLPASAPAMRTDAVTGAWVLGAAPNGSTIAPPAANGAAAPRSSGAYYTPPRLDLTTTIRVPTDPVECLTQAVYYEARNESEEGQAAVAEVVMNRSRSGLYPQDVCGVVYQRNSRTCQFTFTCDGAIGRGEVDMVKWARAERIARDVHQGRNPAILPASSVNYHAFYVSPSWGRRLERVRQIGAHIFYGAALGGGVTPGAVDVMQSAAAPVSGGLVFVRNEGLDRAYEAVRNAAAAAAANAQAAAPGGPGGQP